MAYDNSSVTGDEICDYHYDIENNFMNPPSPTGFFMYKVIGGAFDWLNDLVTQFRNDYSILDCNVGNVEIVNSFPEEPNTNHTYYVSTVDGLTKYSYNGSEWVSEIVTGDVLNSLDVFWGRSYNLLRPILYEGSHREYFFEDICTSTNNKSSGYVLNTGSYSFDSDGLVIESEPTSMWFTDDGTSASHTDGWTVSNGTMTRESTYTRLVESAQTLMCQMNSAYINPSSIVEFDFKAVDGVKNWGLVYIRNSGGGSSLADLSLNDVGGEIGEWIHLKIVFNDTDTITIYSSKLDEPVTKTLSSTDSNGYRLLLYCGGVNTELHFKNVKVFRNYQANLRLDDSNVYDVPFTVEFDLINDGNDQFRMYFHNTSFSNSAIGSGSLWTSPNGQTTKVRFVVTEDGITRYIGNTKATINLSDDVASTVGVRFGYWQPTQSSIKIRNYKVYRGDEKERPLTDEEYKIYLYLRNHQLLTMKDLLVAFTNAFGSAEVTTTLLNSIHTVDHKKYDAPSFSNDTLAALDSDDTDIITDKLVDKSGVDVINDRFAQGTLSIQIPDEGWDEEFLSLLESFISIKGNILISQGG